MLVLEMWFAVAVLAACAGVWRWVHDRAQIRAARCAGRLLELADAVSVRALETDLRVLAGMHVSNVTHVHPRPHRAVGTLAALGLTGMTIVTPWWWHTQPGSLVGWPGALWAVVLVALTLEALAAWGYLATLRGKSGAGTTPWSQPSRAFSR